jgi:hypothetical protein
MLNPSQKRCYKTPEERKAVFDSYMKLKAERPHLIARNLCHRFGLSKDGLYDLVRSFGGNSNKKGSSTPRYIYE